MKLACFLLGAIVCGLSALAQCAPSQREARVFRESFETPKSAATWQVVHGNWAVQDGAYCQRSASGPGYRYTLVGVPFAPDLVTVEATPVGKNDYGFASFGVVIKYVDASNWAIVRFGSYGGLSLMFTEDGKKKVRWLGTFAPELGRTYRVALAWKEDRVAVLLDGALRHVFRARVPGKRGRLGLFTEGPCRFDNFEAHAGGRAFEAYVSGVVARTRAAEAAAGDQVPRSQPPPPSTPAGTPELELEFAAYRPAPSLPEESLPCRGGVYLYVRNRGTGPAQLHRLLVAGKDADALAHTVAWYRQRPASLGPGGVGEILIRLSALPIETAVKLFESPAARPALPVTVEPRGGKALDVQVPLTTRPDPFQINYVGFAPSLQRLYVYVQQDASGDAKALHLSRLSVNGRDLTTRAQFGQKEVGRAVVPIVVDLPKPLRKGQPAVVCIGTREGARAGHAVRAFPGEFHIQVTLLGKQTRPDAVEDVWRHGATCIGLCGASVDHLLEAKALGLAAFHYGRGGLRALRRFDQPKYPAIAGFWLDEMDKLPVRRTFDAIRECELACAKQGEFTPLQMINLCQPRVPGAADFYELGDAACSAYGFHGGAMGEQFGRVAGLPHREYRLTRRTFTPYFRNAEMPVLVDPEAKKVLGREPKHRRCIEPREERWMTYGCLIQGAKGIMHWNYGAWVRKPPGWFSKTQWLIRASLGGALGHRPHGYEIPKDMADDLRRVWDEIGRINVELRAIGPLVAVSDVSDLAQVVAVTPERSPSGEPAAEAAALVSGLDSIVLIVLNHNIRTSWKASADRGIESYDPVDATVELRLPPWLKPRHTFRVRHDGVHKLAPKAASGRLVFRFKKLEVSEAVVVTERDELMGTTAATVKQLRARLVRKPE